MKVSNKIEKIKSTKKNNHPFSNIGQNYSKLLQSLRNVSDKNDNSTYQEKQTQNSTKKLT